MVFFFFFPVILLPISLPCLEIRPRPPANMLSADGNSGHFSILLALEEKGFISHSTLKQDICRSLSNPGASLLRTVIMYGC